MYELKDASFEVPSAMLFQVLVHLVTLAKTPAVGLPRLQLVNFQPGASVPSAPEYYSY